MSNIITLRGFLLDVYAPLRGIDQRTVDLIIYTIKPFAEFLGREPTLDDLDELTLARFIAHRLRSRAAATVKKDRSHLRACWEFAARRGLVKTWPTIVPIKVPERVPEAWTTDQMRKLIESAGKEQVTLDGIPAGLWWRALLMLAYDTGERCSALVEMRWRQFLGDAVIFTAETRKKKQRDILREISPETVAALLAIRGSRGLEEKIFPWPRTQSYLWRRLEIILKRAGLPSGRRDKFHRIRRTTASYYEAAGGSAQRLRDHASPQTTRLYLDPRIVKGVSAPSVIPRLTEQPPGAAPPGSSP